jgi:hypothetical protein
MIALPASCKSLDAQGKLYFFKILFELVIISSFYEY